MRQNTSWISALLFLSAFLIGLLGLNPTFYADDSPETIVSSSFLGIAHPPGYPLFTLLGRIFSTLPIGPASWRVNLLATFLAALVCLLLFQCLRRFLDVPPLLNFGVSLLWMAGATTYPAALSAKTGVYQMTALFLLSILYLLLDRRWRPAAFLFGLSLCNHWMSMVAYAPGFLFFIREQAPEKKTWVRPLLESFAWVLLGCSVYLLLPLRGAIDPIINWGHPTRFYSFLDHVTRNSYQGLGPGFSLQESFWILLSFLRSSFQEFPGLWLPAAIGLALMRRRMRGAFWGTLLLWGGLPAALFLFSRVPRGKAYLLNDYSISSHVLILFWSAFALVSFHRWLEIRGRKTHPLSWGVLLVCLGLTAFRFFQGRQVFYTYTYDYAMNAMRSVPKEGLLSCKGDVLDFPFWYLQMVENRRPDLGVLGSGSLAMDWYRIRLAKARPDLTVPFPNHEPGKEYLSGNLFLWIFQKNPQGGYAFTYPPETSDGLPNLPLFPYGLTLQAPTPKGSPAWDEDRAVKLWKTLRLRHYADERSLDDRSWDTFLRDYAMARSWMGLFQKNAAETLRDRSKNKGLEPGAQLLYIKSLGHFRWASLWDEKTSLYPFNAGMVLYRLGDDNHGLDWMEKAIALDPGNAEAHFYAGLMAAGSGDKSLASMLFEKALQLDPNNLQISQALERLKTSPK